MAALETGIHGPMIGAMGTHPAHLQRGANQEQG